MKITQQLAQQPTVATVDCALCPQQEHKALPVSQQHKCPPASNTTYCVFGGNSAQEGGTESGKLWHSLGSVRWLLNFPMAGYSRPET